MTDKDILITPEMIKDFFSKYWLVMILILLMFLMYVFHTKDINACNEMIRSYSDKCLLYSP